MWWRFIPISPLMLTLAWTKFKLKATGKENVPIKGPFIIITNHQTVYDAFAVGLAIPWTIYRNRIVPWAKVEIGSGAEGKPGQLLYHWLRAIPIHRDGLDEMEETVRQSLKHLSRRELIMIFPEGTRQKFGQLAPFQYGAANLSRAVPCPILPVGVYRRREDRGMQVHFGEPFFMPDLNSGPCNQDGTENSPEGELCREVDMMKQQCIDAGFNRKGMRLVTKQVRSVSKKISEGHVDLNLYCKMADEKDNEFLRNKLLEALPDGWNKIEDLSEEDKRRSIRTSVSTNFQRLDRIRADSGWHLSKEIKVQDKILLVREMTREEFTAVLDWAAKEGWNPGIHDGDSFYYTDPQGFLIGLLDDEPVAAVSGVRYDEDFSFAGFFIVKKEFRYMGFGTAIGNELLQRLSDHNVGIDAVTARQALYTEYGFKTAYKTVRFEGIAQSSQNENRSVTEIHKVRFKNLVDYDSRYFPAKRDVFLRHWIDQSDSLGLVSIARNKIKGYGLIRKCYSGFKIGPLFADNAEIAGNIFNELSSWASESTIYIDVPVLNQEGAKLVTNRGMRPVFETVRMYNKEIPELPMAGIFGNTSFELG